jgi:Coenzyme PQQ synthesis protein D (PqqD)
MKVEITNNPGSASCAPGPQTVGRGMRSSVEPSAGEASPTQKNEHPHRPTRRSNVHVRVVEGEVVMLDRQAGLIHQLNHTASHIWGLCDGQRTLAEIANQLALTFDTDASTAAQDVATLIRQFHSLRLLESC